MNIAKIEKAVTKVLHEEGYYQADHPNFEECGAFETFGMRIVHEKSALVCGYDGDAEMYFVTEIYKDGRSWVLSDDSNWFETQDDALAELASANYEVKND